MAKIKFMGTSHEHHLEKGDTFGGRISDPLPATVIFHRGNHWIVDTDEVGLSPEAVEVILTDTESFRNVTGMKSIPLNQHQRTFLGMTGDFVPEPEEVVDPDAAPDPELAPLEGLTLEERASLQDLSEEDAAALVELNTPPVETDDPPGEVQETKDRPVDRPKRR